MTGSDLKKHREKLKMSQEKLAHILEVSLSTVSRWEQLKAQEIPNSKIIGLALKGLESQKTKKAA